MQIKLLEGILIPFLGTLLGASFVFFMKNEPNKSLEKSLMGFAGGVMMAASIWSLLLPALEQSSSLKKLSFIPAVIGFWTGILFLFSLDKTIPHLHLNSASTEGRKGNFQKTTMLVLAVALHNLPEGMAIGIIYAGWLSESHEITLISALILAIGIAIQNIPEGAIISMPLYSNGLSKRRSFIYAALSGIVEPLGALITLVLAKSVLSFLPYLLSFVAGAMIYVIVEELIPEMSQGKHSNLGTFFFAVGFTCMMILDRMFS